MEPLLYIQSHNYPPHAARHCKQELKLIDTSITKRCINGDLIKLRGSKKLWTKIACNDETIPDLLELELGQILQIGCIVRLWKKVTPHKTMTLKHQPCAHSIKGHDAQGKVIYDLGSQQIIDIPKGVVFISYRPWVNFMVTKIETNLSESHKAASWIIEGEEV